MPHLVLEYSNNLPGPVNLNTLFKNLHLELVELASVRFQDIKSRAMGYDQFMVGSGSPESIFIHLTVSLLHGRSVELRKQIGEALLSILKDFFSEAFSKQPCDITVDIREMTRETYCKAMNG